MQMNNIESKHYNYLLTLNDEELDNTLTELFKECGRINNCAKCIYSRGYENFNCYFQLAQEVGKGKRE